MESSALAQANARAVLRAVLAVLVVVIIGVVAVRALAPRPGGAPDAVAHRRFAGAPPGGARPRGVQDIVRLDPCRDPWPGGGRRDGFCAGYGGCMWGGASERENFSPDAPGACSGAGPDWQKTARAARLEQQALRVAAGMA
jgi:hypothetical protein